MGFISQTILSLIASRIVSRAESRNFKSDGRNAGLKQQEAEAHSEKRRQPLEFGPCATSIGRLCSPIDKKSFSVSRALFFIDPFALPEMPFIKICSTDPPIVAWVSSKIHNLFLTRPQFVQFSVYEYVRGAFFLRHTVLVYQTRIMK